MEKLSSGIVYTFLRSLEEKWPEGATQNLLFFCILTFANNFAKNRKMYQTIFFLAFYYWFGSFQTGSASLLTDKVIFETDLV
jgi:hypothetical protein